MPYNPDVHHRRSIRLKSYDYAQAGAYYITLVVKNRECLFGDITDGALRMNDFGRIVAEAWEWLAKQYPYVTLDAWIVMPNHLHAVIVIMDDQRRGGGGSYFGRGDSRIALTRIALTRTALTSTAPTKRKPLGRLIGAFKTVSTKRINELRGTPGIALWQRNYYEHVIRDEREIDRVREYIGSNPARWEGDAENPNHP